VGNLDPWRGADAGTIDERFLETERSTRHRGGGMRR
jgi:hypothetical protein